MSIRSPWSLIPWIFRTKLKILISASFQPTCSGTYRLSIYVFLSTYSADSSITDSSIEQLKVRFPNVKHLNLSGCYMLTDRAIKILADEMGENFVSLTLNSMNSIR